jgi:predicted permease
VLQIAVSLVLLSGALLLVRSFWNLITLNPGFRQEGVFVTYLNLGRQPPERLEALKTELLERIRSIPQVQAAATTSHVPLYGSSWTMGVRVTGAKEVREGSSKITWVSPDYFKTMEIPVLSGRDFNEHDTATAPKVVLVNETFLRRFLGNADPIGATVRTGAEPGYPEATYEVIGVVKDAKYGNLRQEIPPIAFAPARQHPISAAWAAVVVRSAEPLPGTIAAVKQRVAELDRSIRMDTSVLRTQVREGLARERLMAWLSGFFGLLAAVLVMIGLYGLLSFITLTRRNELGIRLALGARRGNILWLVLRQGLKLAAVGIAIGLAGALALTRLMRGLLFGIDPGDPATLIAMSLLLIAVASLACWLPARRAARVDPIEALRYE